MCKRSLLFLMTVGAAIAAPPAKIVLVAGKPSHGPGEHEHTAGVLLLEKCLRQNKGIEPVAVKDGWPADDSVFDGARSIVLFVDGGPRNPILENDRLAKIGQFMQKGVGLVLLHYSVEVPKENGAPQFLEWVGGFYEKGYSKNPINDVDVTQASPKHPISRGWKSFHVKDEWYYQIRFQPGDKRFTPILTAGLPVDAPKVEPLAWVVERKDGGRGFGFTGCHFHTNLGIPEFRRLVLNAILWTAKVDVPRAGAACEITPEDLTTNLDPKQPRQPRQPKKK